jgi:Flp pilus assembly protein TadD
MKEVRERFEARWFRAVVAAAWLTAFGISLAAQAKQKAPGKPRTSASTQEKEDPLAPLLKQANDAIDKMDFAAALDPLQKYIAQRPDEAYAHFQLGYAYVGLKRSEDAAREFSRATVLDPKMAAAYQNLGLVLMDSDPAAAANAFLHAAELQPAESRPRYLAGVCLERAGKFPEAIEQYRAALSLSPKDYEAHFALARTLLRSNDAASAEVEFRAAIETRGEVPAARLGLASALLAEEKYEAASDAFAEYLKLKPDDLAARFDRASALLHLDHYDDALAELDRSDAGADPSAQHLKMRSEIYMQLKKWSDAARTLAQAISLAPRDSELAEWLGHVDIELHDYPAAIRVLTEATSRDPKSADALRDLADALFLNEEYASALAALDKLAGLEPPKPGSWFVRAICYDKLSRKARAIDAYQKFLDQDNGQHDTQDFQARHRILALQAELGKSAKRQKP